MPLAVVAVVLSWIGLFVADAAAEQPIDFAHQIVPILKKHCAECHAGEKRKGGFSINTREAMLSHGETVKSVVPGDAKDSEVMYLLTDPDPDIRMPSEADPLSPEQIALIGRWINEGVAWEPGFTFGDDGYKPPLKPQSVELPAGDANPIDRLLGVYYEKHEVSAPPVVDDAVFMRRLYLDVIGLPPTPVELEKFLADPAPDKRAKLVDAVLARQTDYAVHWLTFWNDLLRNDYRGTGYIDGGRKQITGWLYHSLENNKPYDVFVRELISPSAASEGFINGIKWRGRVNASQTREIQFSQNISQVFLGINMKCASCHDSFIDDWKLKDAYALAAIVAKQPLEIHRCDKPIGKTAEAGFIFPSLGTINADQPREKRLAELAQLMTHPDNGRTTRTIVNRMWHRLMGRGLVEPIDAMATRPWNEDLLNYLAVYLADHNYDLKKLITLIVNSQAYQARSEVRPEPAAPDEYVFEGPVARRMTAEQFLDAVWTVTDTHPKKINAPLKDYQGPVRAALVHADPLMRSLGRPNREQVVTERPDQLSTLQALDLTNGQIITQTLTRGASHLIEQHAGDPEALIERVYLHALSRKPTDTERSLAARMVGHPMTETGTADLLWGVFMLPEFQLVR